MNILMPDPRDHDDPSLRAGPPGRPVGDSSAGRPWLGLHFRCAGQYVRAYRNAAGTAYCGRCPRCSRTIRFAVGPGGTSERMFEVSC